MKTALVLPAVTMLLLATPIDAQQVCKADALPTIDDVEQVLVKRLDPSLARLVGLEKTDGQLADVSGVKVYNLYYRADIQFVDSAFINPFDLQRAQIAGDWFTINKPGPYMFKANHRAGERLEFAGTMEFDRTERGWREGGAVYCGWPSESRMAIAAKADAPPAGNRDPAAAGATSPVPPKVGAAFAAPADPRLFLYPTTSPPHRVEDFGRKAVVKEFPELSGYATGFDFEGPGDAVAAADGRVVQIVDIGRKDKDFGLGNTVILEHALESGDTLYSLYAHLAGLSSEIRMGQMVRRGTVIGPIGSSGNGREKYWISTSESPRCVRAALSINPRYCVRLHFELKRKPVLENPSGEKVCQVGTLFGSRSSLCYGYTPKDPTEFGYVDPKTVFGRVRVKADSEPSQNQPRSAAPVVYVAATGLDKDKKTALDLSRKVGERGEQTRTAVAAVLDFDEYVAASDTAKGRPSLNLIRLRPLVIFSGGTFESLMASLSVGPGSQPYGERLREAQNKATQRLSQLQQRLSPHRQFSVFVEGEERATFSVARCLIDDKRGNLRCEGTLRVNGPEPQDVRRWLAGAIALSPAVPQKQFWTVQLTQEQQKELDLAMAAVFGRARTFVPTQRQLRQSEDDTKTIVLDLNTDGRPEVFRMGHSNGQPCGEMLANFFGTWAGSSWRTVRASIYLEECVGRGEAAGEDNFSPLFVDIDGDGVAEILMTEGRYESHEWSLYRFVGGTLQKVLKIGTYGS